MELNTVSYRITGTAPCMLHNGRTSNPLDTFAKGIKKITSKRKKSDDDIAAIGRIEFMAGLYWDKSLELAQDGETLVYDTDGTGLFVPAYNIDLMLHGGAKLVKLGQHFKRGCRVVGSRVKFEHSGPNNPEKLWSMPSFRDFRPVKVGQQKVIRCRPYFTEWAFEFTVAYDPSVLNESDLTNVVKLAGDYVGFGDHRPYYGLFEPKQVS